MLIMFIYLYSFTYIWKPIVYACSFVSYIFGRYAYIAVPYEDGDEKDFVYL